MARAKAGKLRFGTVDSFLIWRLTKGGRHATDATNAARTQLYDIRDQAWSERLLDYFGVPAAVLPAVRDCVDDFGVADGEWFGAPIPIRGVAGDQQAALVGQACFDAGMAKCTYGTGCFLIVNTGPERRRSTARLLTTTGYRLRGRPTYAVEGSIFNAGVAVKWLRDQLGLVASAAETEAAARRIDGDTGGVFVVPAFTGLGAPHWRPDARGLITGLTLDTGRDHIVAATLKGIAFQTADLLAAAASDGVATTALRVDGGMAANNWFCQFLADIAGTPVARPANIETTVLGAGMLAAVGAGLYADPHAAARVWHDAPPDPAQPPARRFVPSVDAEVRAGWLDDWHAALARAL
jgi:glycerol kinase